MSAAYVGVTKDAKILDFAFAMEQEDGSLTHGVDFNLFASNAWSSKIKIVPYNRIADAHARLIDAGLAQLEPIPAVKITKESEKAIESKGLPPPFQKLANEWKEKKKASPTTAALVHNPHLMPLPTRRIALSLRREDALPAVQEKIVQAIHQNEEGIAGVAISQHYLADSPVHGDETSLPPVALYEIIITAKE